MDNLLVNSLLVVALAYPLAQAGLFTIKKKIDLASPYSYLNSELRKVKSNDLEEMIRQIDELSQGDTPVTQNVLFYTLMENVNKLSRSLKAS